MSHKWTVCAPKAPQANKGGTACSTKDTSLRTFAGVQATCDGSGETADCNAQQKGARPHASSDDNVCLSIPVAHSCCILFPKA
jgi:hypothetical protein